MGIGQRGARKPRESVRQVPALFLIVCAVAMTGTVHALRHAVSRVGAQLNGSALGLCSIDPEGHAVVYRTWGGVLAYRAICQIKGEY